MSANNFTTTRKIYSSRLVACTIQYLLFPVLLKLALLLDYNPCHDDHDSTDNVTDGEVRCRGTLLIIYKTKLEIFSESETFSYQHNLTKYVVKSFV